MKKTTLTEDAPADYQKFFDEAEIPRGELAFSTPAAMVKDSPAEDAQFLDKFLVIVKWIFLYLPGATAIHFIMLGLGLLFFYRDAGAEMFLGTLGVFAVATFMIVLGVGNLRDLKYLKVVLAVTGTSLLMAILYSILIVFIPGDFFGFFAKLTLPLTLLIGFLVKRNTDEKED